MRNRKPKSGDKPAPKSPRERDKPAQPPQQPGRDQERPPDPVQDRDRVDEASFESFPASDPPGTRSQF